MSWINVGAGAVSLVGGLVSGKQASSGAKVEGGLQAFGVDSPFGNFQGTGGKNQAKGLSVSGFDTSLADLFKQFGLSSLGEANSINTVTTPGERPFDLLAQLGIGSGNQVGATANSQGYSQAGQDALGALGSFDPNAFAQQQYDRMTNLERPGEQRAAADLADRLFSRGRLGGQDSTAGRAFGDLSLSQSQAADSRALSAFGLANTEQTRLGQQAAQFGQLGGQLANSNASSLLNSFGTARDDQFNTANFSNLLKQMLVGNATAGQAGQSAGIDQFLQLAQLAQQGQRDATSAKLGQSSAAAPLAIAKADATGQLFSGVSNAISTLGKPAVKTGQVGGIQTLPGNINAREGALANPYAAYGS